MLKSATRFAAVTVVITALFSTKTLAATPPDFAAPVTVSNASPIAQMVMGDFDGDGVPDVAVYGVVYGTNTFGEVQVHFGNGSGGFKAVTGELQLPLNGNSAMAAGDVLGAGKSQLVFAMSSEVGVYAWNGTSFDNPTNIDLSASGIDATAIAVGNLTTTNSQDIVVSDDFGSAGVVWIANDGTGHFGTPKPFAAGGEAYYARLALKDVNGDGLADVVLVNATGSYADHNGHAGALAGVLLNNENGTLSSEVYYGNPSLATIANSTLTGDGITVADVDHDGKMDLVCHCHTHNLSTSTDTYYLSVNLGNGDGTFQDGKQFALPHGALDISAADLNNDGRVDVVTADYSGSGFTMTQWAGTGAALSVARQDSVPTTDGMFYDAVTLGYTKGDGTFATFNNDTNIDVLLGSSSQIYNPKNPNSHASKFVVFRNQNSGGGTGGGDALPPATLDIVGAVTPNDPITFSATQFSTADGLMINVQATTTTNNAGSWKGLPDGENGRLVSAGGSVYTNTTYFYPVGNAVYFRAVSSAPGYSNSVSTVVGPITIQSAQLRIGVKLTSTSDPKGTLQISHIGDNLTYTFAWTNVGNLTASNLIVETTVPSYIDATSNLHIQFAQSNLTYNQYGHYVPESNPGQGDARVWWNVADLAPGSSQSLTLVAALGAQVREDQQITVGNDYGVFSSTLQPKGESTGFTSGALPVETTVRGPIAMSIVPDVTQATPGSLINYTITLTNLASYTVSNVVIADPIPEFTHFVAFDSKTKIGTTFLTAKGSPGPATGTDKEVVAGVKKPVAVANPLRVIGLLPTASLPPEEQAFLAKNPLIVHPNDNSDQVVFYIGNLAKGATATVRLTVQVQFINPGDITDGEIKNFDYLGYFTTPAGLVVNTKNDSGNIFTPVAGAVQNAPDLALVKTVSCQTNSPGSQFSVILAASNRGASAAQDVFIQDRLPTGAQLVTPSGTVVTSGSSQSNLNAAVSFITIGKSKSTTTSQANYFVTLDPDGTLTIHGLTLNANNGTVGLFYTLQIPDDAPVPSTLISGTSFVGAGNGSQSVVGSGANKHILSVPTGTPSEIPIQIAGDVQLHVSQPISIVTQPTITTDVAATAAQLDTLYAKNINASAYVKGATKTSPPAVIPGVDRFAIYYQNFGSNTASDVHVKFTLPANSVFYRAAFFAKNGLISNKFAAGQSISEPAKLAAGDVVFNIGNVPAGNGGYLMVEVLLTPGAINASGSKIVLTQPLIYSGAAPASLPKAVAKDVSTDSGGTIVYDGANVPKVGIIEVVPQAVWTNGVFAVQFAAFNYADVNLSEGCEVTFQAPAGTEFYRLTGDASIISSNATSLDLSLGIVKHYASGFTIFLRSTGPAGSTIDINSLVAKFPYCGTVKPTPVRIRVSDQFPAHTTITTVSGAQFVTLGELVVIPLGQYEPGVGTAIVAGPSDNFGAQDNTTLLSDDGYGNIIVAGRAGQIPLVNMPVLNSTDTKSALAQLATIVGKHGGNVFNGPQGILLAADGESFVDNDSGSIAGTVKQMLAAGAQSVLPSGSAYFKPTVNGTLPSVASVGGGLANVSGGGYIVTAAGGAVNNDAHAKIDPNAGGQLIGQDGAGLIGQDGAGLIGQDGAGLIGQDGAGLVSSPASSGLVNTAQGNMIATGAKIVASGAGN